MNGTARRAVARWAWRLFRREWRQQILVLALLTAAVAASIGLASAAYSTAPAPDNAVFGAASHFVRFGATDPKTLEADVAAAGESFDSYQVIYHRKVSAPGLHQPVDYRTQDPNGPLGGPRLDLVKGDYPAGGQVAITQGVADVLRLDVGMPVALDGTSRTVVGIVENPGDLSDDFVLLPMSQTGAADEVTILVNGSDEQVRKFRPASGIGLDIGSRQANAGVVAATGVLVIATVGLLLIALVAAASFVVIAHRRMRQLGMLAAIGATERQLRLVTLTNGVAVGGVAAVIGATIGFAGWIAAAPLVEDTVGYRVDELGVPWWLIAAGMLLAVVAGAAAAWWPARSVARVPTVHALSGRPPQPRPARRAATLAVVFAVAGVTCLALSGDVADETAVIWTNAGLVVTGIVALALGVLMACPPAIRVLAGCVGRLPVAVRLAVGDLARYRARSGAALAAISLALGIAVATVASASAAQAGADEGNLPEDKVLIRARTDGPFVPRAAELPGLRSAVDRLVGSFDDPRVTQLDVALDPDSRPDPSFDGRPAISLVERADEGWRDVSLLYVATPQLLAYYEYELGAVRPGTVVITRETGELAILQEGKSKTKVDPLTNAERIRPGYESLPGTFVTTDVLRAHGWVVAPSGQWLVELSAPPTTGQLAAARELAAGAGLTVEVRDRQRGLGALRSGATAVGMLVALGILAMTVGLVRSEGAHDLRVLTAVGAASGTRRTLTAATAGGLAVLGVILGTAGAYAGLIAAFAGDLDTLNPVPYLHLAVIAVGLPVSAAVAGWLVSGREPAEVARQPME